MPTVLALDHIVLRSRDIERSLRFYCDILGMAPVRVDEWREGKVPFPSVRVSPDTLIDFVAASGEASNPTEQLLAHYCLVVDRGQFEAVHESIVNAGFTVSDTRSRFGARGRGESFYVHGPEGIEVEIKQA